MGGTHTSSARRHYRRARQLRRDARGVVAVVGTLLALLVFFALFGIFLTQYVPLWMTDNESQFTSQTATSFAEFKSQVDSQYTLDGPPTYGSSFAISSNGIPLLAQPTEGTLAFLPSTCPNGFYTKATSGSSPANYGQPVSAGYCVFENVSLSVGPGGSGLYSPHVPSGVLEMVLPNRYYSPQTFYFEDDAVVQSQGGVQQILTFPPPLNVTTVASNTTISTSFLQLYGNASTVVGQGSEQVYSHLRYAQVVTSNGTVGRNGLSLFNFTYEIGTQYPCAWEKFLTSIMNVSGVPLNTGRATGAFAYPTTFYNWTNRLTSSPTPTIPVSPSNCTSSSGATTILSLRITNVDFVTVFYAGIQITVGIGES